MRFAAPLVGTGDLIKADPDPDRGRRFLRRPTALELIPDDLDFELGRARADAGAPFDIRTGIFSDRDPSRVRS
ncbi:hypothetical protein AB0C98_19825 [Streptomyces sp. NPDC048558]|uniref:hypothetical protein n=1 Tax=Streptomyces sp. NPDC048558 TaxID=3155759 RepID=UPI003441889E